MSNLCINRISPVSAEVQFSACKLGDYYTEGTSSTQKLVFTDCENTRQISGHLFDLYQTNFDGLVHFTLEDGQQVSLDSSLWRDLSDALLGFFLCIDIETMDRCADLHK